MHTVLRLALICLLPLPSLTAAGGPWTQLKLGMSAVQAANLLGDPVLRSAGRGFETWTYDDGAELVLHGTVVGWTAPASAGLRMRSQDVWLSRPAGRHYATLHAVLTDPARPVVAPPPPAPAAKRKTPANGVGFEDYIRG